MMRFDPLPDPDADDALVCEICGATIPLGSEYVTIAAENEHGEIIGTLMAHAACADALSEDELGALMRTALGEQGDPTPDYDEVLPLEHCCLCGGLIGDADYLNLIEPMHPGDPHSPLVATSFHADCYRADPDGVQRALDEEIQKQRRWRAGTGE